MLHISLARAASAFSYQRPIAAASAGLKILRLSTGSKHPTTATTIIRLNERGKLDFLLRLAWICAKHTE